MMSAPRAFVVPMLAMATTWSVTSVSAQDLDSDVPIAPAAAAAATGVGLVDDDDGVFGDQVGTAQGDILEAQGDLAKDAGKAMVYRALSAERIQKAIDQRLDNRRESVETYFQLRDLNEKEREERGVDLTPEQINEINKQRAPKRLTESELNPQSGELQWPGPLAAKSLSPYRKPIEMSFARRSSPGEDYGQFDFFRVDRMIRLIRRAMEGIEDELAAQEIAALDRYLDRVSFEARFNAAGERIDY